MHARLRPTENLCGRTAWAPQRVQISTRSHSWTRCPGPTSWGSHRREERDFREDGVEAWRQQTVHPIAPAGNRANAWVVGLRWRGALGAGGSGRWTTGDAIMATLWAAKARHLIRCFACSITNLCARMTEEDPDRSSAAIFAKQSAH
eukprot:733676-Pyramimonas_sp.AAC.1